ncbi:2-oxoglutarate dehydrogenase, E2 component, dihydrolipoamide succinyltransferase [bacterium]|nr:MAG: 2-oxoglutarate dehydrogenase, E2 component, dihydrolipoamide succinyltransferase [bacterium]
MATDVLMPQMGESIAEGTITKWLKKVGDAVERDEPLYEISTDKVDAEIPSPESGVLTEIIVGEGETVEVKTLVARISVSGEAAEAAPADDAVQEDAPAANPAAPAAQAVQPPTPAAAPAPSQPAPAAPATPATPAQASTREQRIATKSSPLVRRIAAEHGIDLTQVTGSGIHGRVTRDDVMAFISSGGAAPAAQPAAQAAAAPLPGGAGDRVEPMSRMRSIIAHHMIESQRTSAHVHTFYEIDMSRVDQIRGQHKEAFAQRTGGARLTYTVFVMKAVVDALREHEVINASLDGENIVYHSAVNLGMAVALDWGLIVPVIENAQDLSMEGLAKAITDKATRARDRKLGPDEISGSTFSITNPGSYGSIIGTPIINQPNVAILGMGKVEKRVCVVDDMITIRPKMFITLGYDHRLVDGAAAEKFLSSVQHTLENFDETAL